MVEGGSTDSGRRFHWWWNNTFLVGNSVPLLVEDGSTIWAGYSHYLGWIFPLSGLDIPIILAGYFCSLSPLQGAPCPPYRVLPVPPTDWVVKRDFKSFWGNPVPLTGFSLSPQQGSHCPPYRVLPVPPTDWVVKRDFKSFWAPSVPLQLPWLFPYSCPDCSPTGCYLAGYSHYLGWFLSKSGLVFVKIWAGFCQNLGWFCQNLGWFLSKSGLVFVKIWAGFSQNLGWFFSKSGLVFVKIWAGFSQNLGWINWAWILGGFRFKSGNSFHF